MLNIIFTTIVMSAPANTTQRNQSIHHFTTSFHFLSFSSSHALITIINAPYTIEPTARIAKIEPKDWIQDSIVYLNHHSTFKLFTPTDCHDASLISVFTTFASLKQSSSAYHMFSHHSTSKSQSVVVAAWVNQKHMQEIRIISIDNIFFIILFIY